MVEFSSPHSDDSFGMERIPEHSSAMMTAFSGGNALTIGPYRFYYGDDWLTAIAYPLSGQYDEKNFLEAFKIAASRQTPRTCFAIGPELPKDFWPHIREKDHFYVLSSRAPIPKRLRNPVSLARKSLSIKLHNKFTPAHRRLWGEFLRNNSGRMTARVAQLYARTPQILASGATQLQLLDAYDEQGNLAASLLIDFAPRNFLSYIIGAHSRKNYAPHATDLLFSELLKLAKQANKSFIHLGLGVNDGILRFKLKWGARRSLPFLMAEWDNDKSIRAREERISVVLARAILNAPQLSRAQILQNEPSERPFAMLWRVEKNNRVSWLGGTAHFFCHSFESSFRSLFRKVDKVIFEGPLDPQFMADVDAAGKILPPGYTPMLGMLTDREIKRLERVVGGPRGKCARILGMEKKSDVDIRWLLANGLPWYTFFTLWTAFLERMGWRQSVDMEAWNIARDMGLQVIGMETLEEQLESLSSLPVSRAINFFRACNTWKKRARQNMNAYLAGDLEKMMGTSAEFPTRTEHIVGRRDQRFRERMRPYLQEGNAAVFVGSAHLVNLRHMLKEDGFRITQSPYGLWPRLCNKWRQWLRPDEGVIW